MRKVIVSEFVTLDGVIEDPGGAEGFKHGGGGLHFWGGGQQQGKGGGLFKADAPLLGRRAYQGFRPARPHMPGTGGYGGGMKRLAKYGGSTTLCEVTWNATLITGDLAEELSRLKQEAGQDILIFGSGQLVHTLHARGLIDEYRLMVYPVALGSGKRLFGEGSEKKALKLVEATPFTSGVVF